VQDNQSIKVQALSQALASAAAACRVKARRSAMTTIYSTAGQPARQSVPGGFFRMLGSWVNGIVSYLARRQAIQTLSELDDRALRDIGIERSRIESAVRGNVDPDFGRIM
jgi:uncharacterized protein YjiS (DUF1127 family)